MTHQIIRPRSSYCRIALLALAGASFWLAVGRAQAPSAPPAPAAKAPPSDAPPSSVPDEAAAASEEPAEPAEPSLQLETIPAVEPVPPNVLRTVGNNNFSAPGFVNLKIFSPDGRFLAAHVDVNQMSALWVWNVRTGATVLRVRPAALSTEERIWFSKNPVELHYFFAGNDAPIVHFRWSYPGWKRLPDEPDELDHAQPKRRPHASGQAVTAKLPGQRRFVKYKEGGPFHVYDTASGAELLNIPVAKEKTIGFTSSLSPDGSLLWLEIQNGWNWSDHDELWSVDGRKKLGQWSSDDPTVGSLRATFSEDSRVLAVRFGPREFRCFDGRTGRELSQVTCGRSVDIDPVLSADGKQIALPQHGTIAIFDTQNGKRIHTLSVPSGCTGMLFSPDASALAVALGSVATVFDLRTEKELVSHEGPVGPVSHIRFAQDGSRLAAIDYFERPSEWSTTDGHPIPAAPDSRPAPTDKPDSPRRGTTRGRTRSELLAALEDGPFVKAAEGDGVEPRAVVVAASRQGQMAWTEDGSSFNLPGYDPLKNPEHFYRGPMCRGPLCRVLGLALSADGKTAASISSDRTVRIWKSGEPDAVATFRVSARPGSLIALADDASLVAAAVGGEMLVWDVRRGKPDPIATLKFSDGAEPVGAQFAPDGKTLAVGDSAGRLTLFDPASGKVVAHAQADSHRVAALTFTADGAALYSGGPDGAVISWNPATLEKRFTLVSGLPAILCMAPLDSGKTLAVADSAGHVGLWTVATRSRTRDFKRNQPVRLLSGPIDGDTRTVPALEPGQGWMRLGPVSGDTLSMVVGQSDIRHFDIRTGRAFDQDFVIFEGTYAMSDVATSPDGKLLARAFAAGVRVWNAEDGKLWADLPAASNIEGPVWFSPSGNLLAAGGGGADLRVFRLSDKSVLIKIPSQAMYFAGDVSISPDERFMAVADHNAIVTIWDLRSGQLSEKVPAPNFQSWRSAHFTADSRRLIGVATAGVPMNRASPTAISIWDMASQSELGELPLPDCPCCTGCVSPDDRLLALSAPDGRIWICDFQQIVKDMLFKGVPDNSATLDELWDRLGSADPAAAYRAVVWMSEKPDGAVAVIRSKLPSLRPAVATAAEIAALVDRLASDDPAIRREASSRLLQLRPLVDAALRAALAEHPDGKAHSRLELLLAADIAANDSALRGIRVVEVLERIATPGARELLASLAGSPAEWRLTQEAKFAVARLPPPGHP